MFRATFWGVRGSIPSPGPTTQAIGGNTSCVEVRAGAHVLVFDGGTGLRLLGRKLLGEMPLEVHLFFSHVHWDHIQGFPFFAPAFVPGNRIHMYGGAPVWGTLESVMAGQMEFPNFPVKLDQLSSELVFHSVTPGTRVDLGGGVTVDTARGHHPGGVVAYRVNRAGKSLAYMTDTEFGTEADAGLIALAKDADVLIYDCMYTPEEYRGEHGAGGPKNGWGHSTYEGGVAIAKAAGVRELVLYHHDPDQDDVAVREKEARARGLFPSARAAYEGLTLTLA